MKIDRGLPIAQGERQLDFQGNIQEIVLQNLFYAHVLNHAPLIGLISKIRNPPFCNQIKT